MAAARSFSAIFSAACCMVAKMKRQSAGQQVREPPGIRRDVIGDYQNAWKVGGAVVALVCAVAGGTINVGVALPCASRFGFATAWSGGPMRGHREHVSREGIALRQKLR